MLKITQFSVLLICTVFLAPVFSVVAEERVEQVEQVEQKDEPVWIDVRSWVEHQTDNIEGDPRIHYTDILESVATTYPNKNTEIKLYCASGGRSGKALTVLREAGYTNVENAGGIDDARKARGLSN